MVAPSTWREEWLHHLAPSCASEQGSHVGACSCAAAGKNGKLQDGHHCQARGAQRPANVSRPSRRARIPFHFWKIVAIFFSNSVTVWPCLQLCASQRQLSIAASPNGTARLSEDPAGDEGKPVYRAGHWCSLPKRKEKATVATDAEHAKKKSKAAQTGEDVPFSIYSVFDDDELPDVRSTPSSNVGVIPEDKLSDGTRQNPHDADGDLKGVAAIERGEMREPMMSDARRVRSLTRRSKRLADALLATLVD